jgi:uncharacterized membrane protein YhaH (DUF805 family)
MDLFKGKTGGWNTFLKYFLAWLILFGSKFVILEALSQVFGTKVHFGGMWHGVIALIVVVVVMLVAEELMVRSIEARGKAGRGPAGQVVSLHPERGKLSQFA